MRPMILEGKKSGCLYLGAAPIHWCARNEIWAVHMESGNACSPYTLLRNWPNWRGNTHRDIAVRLMMVTPVMCWACCSNNGSGDVGHREMNSTEAKLLPFHGYP